MVSLLEKQEAFTCKIKYTKLTSKLHITDLFISTFGHPSAFLFCSYLNNPETQQIASISAAYHNETNEIISVWMHKTEQKYAFACCTDKFMNQFSNEAFQILSELLEFDKIICLDAMPTLSYQCGKYETNKLISISSSVAKQEIKKSIRIEPNTRIGGLLGAALAYAEIMRKECYGFIGVMQEYSVSRDSIKVFENINEIVEYVKEKKEETELKKVINSINLKLENNLFS